MDRRCPPLCLGRDAVPDRHRHAAGLQRDLTREVHDTVVSIGLRDGGARRERKSERKNASVEHYFGKTSAVEVHIIN